MGSAEIETRRLGPQDVERVRNLNALFANAFSDVETYANHPPSSAYLSELLAKDQVIVLVALLGERVVGGLVAYEMSKFEQARSEIYIYDLAVAETFRRQGIATALITNLQAIAAQCGAWDIFVQADYVDPPAQALYERLGTREEVLHFDIPV